ncbi:hypothetical protein BRC93_14810, partial [Halobacteriales archaeon QS_5_70_15]
MSLADGREFVVQSRPTGEGLATEARLARGIARRTDVPVPRVVATGTVDGAEYLLAERAGTRTSTPGSSTSTRRTGGGSSGRRAGGSPTSTGPSRSTATDP